MQIVRELSEPVWREYVLQHPCGNIFHTPELLRVFSRARNHQPSLWAVIESSGQPLALLFPVHVNLFGGPLRPLTSRAILYGSALCEPSKNGEVALDMLLDAYKKHNKAGLLLTEFRNLSDLSTFQHVLGENGFVYSDHLNYIIDLNRTTEDLMGGIGPRTRKNLRRALRNERIKVREVTSRSQVELVYKLLKKTYAIVRVPLADKSLFEAAFDILYPKEMIKFLLVEIDGHYAAGSAELLYKDTIYGWYGGFDRDYGNYCPNELLIWHILEWGAKNGYKKYDFGGAGAPDEPYGVREFKAKFGGELVNYGRNIYIHSPIAYLISRACFRTYQFARKLLPLNKTEIL